MLLPVLFAIGAAAMLSGRGDQAQGVAPPPPHMPHGPPPPYGMMPRSPYGPPGYVPPGYGPPQGASGWGGYGPPPGYPQRPPAPMPSGFVVMPGQMYSFAIRANLGLDPRSAPDAVRVGIASALAGQGLVCARLVADFELGGSDLTIWRGEGRFTGAQPAQLGQTAEIQWAQVVPATSEALLPPPPPPLPPQEAVVPEPPPPPAAVAAAPAAPAPTVEPSAASPDAAGPPAEANHVANSAPPSAALVRRPRAAASPGVG